MTLPKNRLGSVKRVFRRAPTGRTVVHYKKPTKAWVKCRLCGAILGGVKDSRRAAKSEKVPSRLFAGQLCAGCVAEIVKARARIRAGEARPEDYSFMQGEFIRRVGRK